MPVKNVCELEKEVKASKSHATSDVCVVRHVCGVGQRLPRHVGSQVKSVHHDQLYMVAFLCLGSICGLVEKEEASLI